MITRGYLVGEIIDGLSSISHQIETRCALGLTDLNKFIEDFFKVILNQTLGTNLVNLNSDRSNEPGLDLGDSTSKRAFQITSQKTSAKISETLDKITTPQLQVYDKVTVFIAGKKQGSYTIEQALLSKVNFNVKEDIWDIVTLSRMMVDLPLDRLKDIYDYLSKEITRVKIDLEVPNAEGQFPTNIGDFVDAIPKPEMGGGEDYRQFLITYNQVLEADIPLEHAISDFHSFAVKLQQLPRITRQFYAFLLNRCESADASLSYYLTFNLDILKRVCHFPDMDGEIRILEEAGLLNIDDSPTAEGRSPIVRIYHSSGRNDFVLKEIAAFLKSKDIAEEKVIVALNFSDF